MIFPIACQRVILIFGWNWQVLNQKTEDLPQQCFADVWGLPLLA
jgi:hypothetical protein